MAPWTPKRREKLRRLAQAGGMSGKQIAAALGSGRSTIMRELKRLGISLNEGNRGFRTKPNKEVGNLYRGTIAYDEER